MTDSYQIALGIAANKVSPRMLSAAVGRIAGDFEKHQREVWRDVIARLRLRPKWHCGFGSDTQKPLVLVWRAYTYRGEVIFRETMFNSQNWIGV